MSRPECFVTELTRVGQALNVQLDMFLHVTDLGAGVVTSLAVEHSVSLLHQLLYLLIQLRHVSEGHNLLPMARFHLVCLDDFRVRIFWLR